MRDEPEEAAPGRSADKGAEEMRMELERVAELLSDRGQSRADLAARFEWLLDLLIRRGQLLPAHRRIVGKLRGARSPVKLSLLGDKRAITSPDLDCASLMPLCGARCCSLSVTLSAEDIAEHRLTWILDEPYVLERREDTGYCLHCGDDGGCGAYEYRPAACRVYDCRNDPRIWSDFAGRVLAPMREGLKPRTGLGSASNPSTAPVGGE